MWIARDKNGRLHIFDRKPWREPYMYGEAVGYWTNHDQATYVNDADIRKKFQHLRWEDDPVEIDIIVKGTSSKPIERYISSYYVDAHTIEGD